MPEESYRLFFHTRESALRFEYFVLGLSVGLCAYIGQTVTPVRLGLNAYTVEVISTILLVASVICGFKRVEAMIATSSLNHDVVDLHNRRARLVSKTESFDERTGAPLDEYQMDYAVKEINKRLPELQRAMNAAVRRSHRYYWIRNWLLLAGFLGVFAAKIIQPYLR